MKNFKFLLPFLCALLSIAALAQGGRQVGYVKTPGRLGKGGRVVAGTRIPNATVTLKGGGSTRSASDGTFTITLPGGVQKFYLQNVQKIGYTLVDPEVLSRQHTCNANPFILVMEVPSQQAEYQLAQEKKLRETIQRELQKREKELNELRRKNKLTEQEYERKLQELLARQETNEKMIAEMAERYARMDFDQIDEFNRRIADCILDGRLEEADSLIRSKGDIHARINKVQQEEALEAQRDEEIRQQQEANDQAKAGTQATKEDIAQDCYMLVEMFKLNSQYDSIYYYLELRADLDTMNVEWQFDAGYIDRALNAARLQYDKNSLELAHNLNRVGKFWARRNYHHSDHAFEFLQEAKDILDRTETDNINAVDSEKAYNHLYFGDYHSSQSEGFGLAPILDEDSIDFVNADYEAGGHSLLANKHYLLALEYFIKLYGNIHPNVALCYIHLGEHNFDSSFFEEALDIYKTLYGEFHSEIADCYWSIARTYMKDNYVYTPRNPLGVGCEVIDSQYSEHEACQKQLEDYKRAVSFLEKAIEVYVQLYGENYIRAHELEERLKVVNEDINVFEHALNCDSPCNYILLKYRGLSDEEIIEEWEKEE